MEESMEKDWIKEIEDYVEPYKILPVSPETIGKLTGYIKFVLDNNRALRKENEELKEKVERLEKEKADQQKDYRAEWASMSEIIHMEREKNRFMREQKEADLRDELAFEIFIRGGYSPESAYKAADEMMEARKK